MSENNVTGIIGATVGIGQYIVNDYVITLTQAEGVGEGEYGYTMTITRGSETQTVTLYGLTAAQYDQMVSNLQLAQAAAQEAQQAAQGVHADAVAAQTAAQNAQTALSQAIEAALAAAQSETNAADFAADSLNHSEDALRSAEDAITANTAAQTAKTDAEAAAAAAAAAQTAAVAAMGAAETAQTAAETAETNAHTYAGQAQQSATNAGQSAASAAQTLTQVQAEGQVQIAAIDAEGQRVIDSIPADYTQMDADVAELKIHLYGDSVDTSGGLLVNGYYIKNNKQVVSSANFNTYKYAISGVKYVEITTYGYNSTAAVASDSDYDASTFPGKTFTSNDKMIFPSSTIGTISAWTEKSVVDGYEYLYVSCYKNNEPVVVCYAGDGALPISIKNENDIVGIKADALSAMHSYTSLLNTADKWASFGNDANNLAPNMVYCITYSSGISNLPYSGFNGFIKSYMAYYGNNTVWMQTATNGTGKRNFSRVLWSGTWTEWQELALASDLALYGDDIHTLFYENDLWKVFHTVGVIGDSLASGESASNEGGSTQYHDLYTFSWGQCMARDSGNTYYNFSKGGLTTKTWMTDPDYGYAFASQEGKLCDMYIIGLGQNDSAQRMTVGSSADINFSDPDANADTFYGNYAKIIQKLRALAPKAPIFVVTRPTVPATNAYETAIRAMPTLFENVFLLDMYKHVNAYYPEDSIIRRCLRSGHYNAIGYQVMSKHIEQEISNVIKANLDDFLQVEFINTEWSWTDQ